MCGQQWACHMVKVSASVLLFQSCPTPSSFNNPLIFLETMSAAFQLVSPSERATETTWAHQPSLQRSTQVKLKINKLLSKHFLKALKHIKDYKGTLY